jgi:hypothetical protein
MHPFQTNVKAWASVRARAIGKFRLTGVTRIFQLSVFTKIALAALAPRPRCVARFVSSFFRRSEGIDAPGRSFSLRRQAMVFCSVPVTGLLLPVIL